MPAERRSRMYRLVMVAATPVVRWWGRLRVEGLDTVPPDGPLVLMANHDSHWDPLLVGVAVPARQVRALAKASLWSPRPLGWVLNGMGQIPIERGRADASALQAAVDVLARGGCIGVFPEGTISRGGELRAQSGAGRLALAVPGTRIVAAVLAGSVDIVRFPRRPRLTVRLFDPGQPQPGESALALTKRVMAQVRAEAPPAVPGRRHTARALRAKLAQPGEHDAPRESAADR